MLTATFPRQSDARVHGHRRLVAAALCAGILLSLIVQGWLAFVQQFNGDEFYFLSLVHDYLRGDLSTALQTLHVHLFAPLALLPSEVEQLIAGRLVMLGFECLTLVSLYGLARAWAGRLPSLLAVLAFVAMPITIQHGASFRADPMALGLSMAALALFARAPLRLWSIAAIALLAASAFLVTIKIIFFAPAFGGIAAWRLATSRDRRTTLVGLGATAAATVAAALALFLLHQSTLAGGAVANSGKMLASAGSTTILNGGFLPGRYELLYTAFTAPVQALLLGIAAVTLIVRLIAGSSRERWMCVALLGCVAPLASLLFYRNSFVYFIPFILASSFIAVAWIAEQRKWAPGLLAILGASMALTAALPLPRLAAMGQAEQRATIAAVHRLFPRPVHYLDRHSMISSFPKQGFLMSTWGMAGYRQHAPMYEQMLREDTVPLLIANHPALQEALGVGGPMPPERALHPQDQQILKENYLPFGRMLWIAGKQTTLGSSPTPVSILVPGRYTLSGAGVTINGRDVLPGQTIRLRRGTYLLSGQPGTQVTLRWGGQLPPSSGADS